MGDEMKMDWDFENDDLGVWGEDEVDDSKAGKVEEGSYLDDMECSLKSMTIFFLIDTSGSMSGTKIGTVNATMEELLPELIGIGGTETEISIAAMRYDTTCEWITKQGPELVEEYQMWPRQNVGGMTAMGAAFRELNSKLSRKAWMNKPSLSFAPVIFLMTDGEPNDDWKNGLAELKKNSWFRYGLKIAVGIGSAPNMDVLREFTGNDELAIQVHDAKQLQKMIKFLAVTSSQIGSKSMSLTDNGKELTAEDVAGGKEKELEKAVVDIMNTDDFSDVDDMDFEAGW